MKKLTSIFMILLLIFSSLGPLPTVTVHAEGDFEGDITEDTVGENNLGTLKVKMNNKTGFAWNLRLMKDYPPYDQQSFFEGGEHTFLNVPPGLYKVEATATGADNQVIKQTSKSYPVRPRPLTANNIKTDVPNQLTVEIPNAATGTKVQLYIGDQKVGANDGGEKTVDNTTKTVTFSIDARDDYKLTQVVNGAESEKLGPIVVKAPTVKLKLESHSGPQDSAGSISVSGTKKDNKLILYRGGIEVYQNPVTADSPTYLFEGLKSGVYTVRQIENGVPSEISDPPVTIENEQVPILTLNRPNDNNVYYELENGIIKPTQYVEHGYTVSYRGIIEQTGTEPLKKFCEELGEESRCVDVSIEYDPMITTIPGLGPLPGKYKVIYTAEDSNDKKYTSTITRDVTVYPNPVTIESINTKEVNTTKPIKEHTHGQIKVSGIFAVAEQETTLTLYQDPTGSTNIDNATQIGRPITQVNRGEFVFPNVPVGEGYFVVQKVNGVVSGYSNRVAILDTTPPEMALNGSNPYTLEAGTAYVEPGVTATDNIDTSEDLATRINITYYIPSKEVPGTLVEVNSIDTNVPNAYTVKYNLTDTAGNKASELIRIVNVTPRAVTAIGSIATIGEIGVKDIFPGTSLQETILQLWKYNKQTEKFEKEPLYANLDNKELTYVFKNTEQKPLPPGRYQVTQTVNGQTSVPSNIVEIVDIDRPYITLNGLETVQIVYGEALPPYYDGTKFTDPSANADDYLETDLHLTARLVGPNKEPTICPKPEEDEDPTICKSTGKNIKYAPVELPVPGVYTITYTATAPGRNSSADEKQRIIELAPPKVTDIYAGKAGDGEIKVINGLFEHPSTETTVTLYNSYGQKINPKVEKFGKSVYFKNVPAGVGYFVTQTVNGIESAPSISVNVSLYEEAPLSVFISSFEFPALKAVGQIDHVSGEITVTVPHDTDVSNLVPVIKTNNDANATVEITVSPKPGLQNFTTPVTYTVMATDSNNAFVEKAYTVTVVKAASSSNTWTDVVQKNVVIGPSSHYTLTSTEKALAEKKGIAFLSKDLSVFVPAPNIKESKVPTLSIQQPAVNTISTGKDSNWTKSITNPIQIEWGGESAFYQPIEVELNNADGKVFSKLVLTANNELYATVQPSYTISNKTVGLVSEPGLYALIGNDNSDAVLKPYIQELSNGNYQIHSLSPDATIYYTTNSQHISYEKSASLPSGNYLLSKSGINLAQWTKVTDYETVQISGNEIYAVAVKDQVISPVSSVVTSNYSSWSRDIKQVDATKIWNVKFNATVEKKALYNNSIYVTDDSTGAVIPTTLMIGNDGQSINVVPANPYDRSKYYTLWVSKEIKGHTINNQFLTQPTKLTFTVK